MEKIEVFYYKLGGKGNTVPPDQRETIFYHKYIVYTAANGEKFAARVGPSGQGDGGAYLTESGSVRDAADTSLGVLQSTVGRYNETFIDFDKNQWDQSEVIASGANLSEYWNKIKAVFQIIDESNFAYRPLTSNCNTAVDVALLYAGLPSPQQDVLNHPSPGSTFWFEESTNTTVTGKRFNLDLYRAFSFNKQSLLDVIVASVTPSKQLLIRDIVDTLFGTETKLWANDYLARLGVISPSGTGLLDSSNLKQLLHDVFRLGNGAGSDPLVLDLNGDGIHTRHFSEGTKFDLDANGFKESTGWITADDVLLVRDLNNNGIIDNGRELFGDKTLLLNGSPSTSGFEALAALDSNNDGSISEKDADWKSLRIWRDINSDGLASATELSSLETAGIAAIGVIGIQPNANIDIGNQNSILQSGQFIRADGTIGLAASLSFMRNTAASEPINIFSESDSIQKLPNIEGFGAVYGLRQAMVADPELQEIVENFVAADWRYSEKYFDMALYEWCTAATVGPNSRGVNVNGQHLTVLEAFYGQPYIDSDGLSNPRQTQGYVLEFAYTALHERLFANAMIQTHLLPYISRIVSYVDVNSTIQYDFSAVAESVRSVLAQDIDQGIWLTSQLTRSIHALGLNHTPGYAAFVASFNSFYGLSSLAMFSQSCSPIIGTNTTETLSLANQGGLAFGQDGDDTIYGGLGADYLSGGSGNDIIAGNGGNDFLVGGVGSDRLVDTEGSNVFDGGPDNDVMGDALTTYFWGPNIYIGGVGNDIAYGSRGSDTYLFNKGDGQDIIHENPYNAGGDILKFGKDISSTDWVVSRSGIDLVISDKSGLDKITITQWFESTDQKAYRIESFVFSDGTAWSATDVTERAIAVYGTTNSDVLKGLDAVADIIHGLSGDDFILGYTGDDKLYGDEGFDTIYGGNGNDLLLGGGDGDILDGEAGDDYLSGGSGNDRLYDDQGTNTFDGGDGDDRLMSSNTTAFWGPNTYIGGKGNDIIFGSRGGDSYIFNLGDGHDLVIENQYGRGVDVLQFGTGINVSELSVTKIGSDLILKNINEVDQITIQNWFYSSGDVDSKIELFKFADGSLLTAEDVVALIAVPTLLHY